MSIASLIPMFSCYQLSLLGVWERGQPLRMVTECSVATVLIPVQVLEHGNGDLESLG